MERRPCVFTAPSSTGRRIQVAGTFKSTKPNLEKNARTTQPLYATRTSISISCIHLLNFVEHAVQSIFQLPEHSLKRRDRRPAVAHARHIAMYLLHTLYGFSFTQIGAYFSRSRKTVAHGCAAIEQLRDDPAMDLVLLTLETALVRPRV